MTTKSKKEMSAEDINKYVAAYAARNGISEAEARRKIMGTGISRLKTLKKYGDKEKTEGGGKKASKKASKTGSKKAAKKAAKKGSAKKASKKSSTKPAKAAPATERKVVEGEEG